MSSLVPTQIKDKVGMKNDSKKISKHKITLTNKKYLSLLKLTQQMFLFFVEKKSVINALIGKLQNEPQNVTAQLVQQ